MLAPWKKSYDQPRQHILKERHYFANKGLTSQSYGFSSSHVRMWEMDYKESRAPKNWCFWTVVLEKTLENPLDCKEIKPVHPKGSQSWIFIGWSDAEAETPILWPPNAKNWLIRKDPDAGKDWSQEVKGMTADEMVGWHHWPSGHEFNLHFIMAAINSSSSSSSSSIIVSAWVWILSLPLASYVTLGLLPNHSLCFSFLICKMDIIILPIL